MGVSGTSTTGRGGLFKGRRPSAAGALDRFDAPDSGSTGDLFVDKSNRLWFCKGGTDWKPLA